MALSILTNGLQIVLPLDAEADGGKLLNDNFILLDSHLGDTDNPHSVDASQVGAYTSDEVDSIVSGYLPLAGGTMSGTLDLDGYNVNNAGILTIDTGQDGTATGFSTNNADAFDRLTIQPQSGNRGINFFFLPSGTASNSSIQVSNSSDIDSRGRVIIECNGSSGYINADSFGGGTDVTSLNLGVGGYQEDDLVLTSSVITCNLPLAMADNDITGVGTVETTSVSSPSGETLALSPDTGIIQLTNGDQIAWGAQQGYLIAGAATNTLVIGTSGSNAITVDENQQVTIHEGLATALELNGHGIVGDPFQAAFIEVGADGGASPDVGDKLHADQEYTAGDIVKVTEEGDRLELFLGGDHTDQSNWRILVNTFELLIFNPGGPKVIEGVTCGAGVTTSVGWFTEDREIYLGNSSSTSYTFKFSDGDVAVSAYGGSSGTVSCFTAAYSRSPYANDYMSLYRNAPPRGSVTASLTGGL
jgi:hypothetical protein